MNQAKYLTAEHLLLAPPDVLKFIEIWQKETSRPVTQLLCLCDVLDLLMTFSTRKHKDWSDGRTFNNILINEESILGWDGEDKLYIFWYELVLVLKRLIVVESLKRARVAE